MSLHPPIVKVVPHLDAPWKIITDKHSYKSLLVRQGTPISEHLVNMINDIYNERRHRDQLRRLIEADNPRWQPAPRPRAELAGLELVELKEMFAGRSWSGIYRMTRYSIRLDGSPQEN
ncbi:hypothetical protein JOF56_000844 [Kibdelosporangium banguiense]|uniref:Uncharacterized protein n=1 Tax=Kibdelosporangium banguiense TaxID=1365924 RepID=A0ABS4T7S1_9PSEU|nr:hypothetical protein [Kibdelosporangium banguiense]MBP2320459.1 hypothetical protein [Kibdelosporangium banguiense]